MATTLHNIALGAQWDPLKFQELFQEEEMTATAATAEAAALEAKIIHLRGHPQCHTMEGARHCISFLPLGRQKELFYTETSNHRQEAFSRPQVL